MFSNEAGTTRTSFQVGGPTGVRLSLSAGVLQTRNAADTAFADLYAGNLQANNPTVGVNDAGAIVANGVVRHGTGVQSYGVGTGAVIGTARGSGASDLQTTRTAANQVASGVGSFVAGVSNRASGDYATALGQTNVASNTASTAIGALCTSSGIGSTALGNGTTASGDGSTAMGTGSQATATGATAGGNTAIASGVGATAFGTTVSATADYSTALGTNSIADLRGALAVSGGSIAANSDSQTMIATLGGTTTDATPGTLGLDGVLNSASELILTSNTAWAFRLQVALEITGGGTGKVLLFTGGIRRPGAGAAVFIGGVAPVASTTIQDAGLVAATLVLSAPGGGTLRFTATGIAATTINWTATIWLAKVAG